MRAHDFNIPTTLSEVKMSPSSLRTLASRIKAHAGIEFEMYVPNTSTDDNGSDESDPDYSTDERASDIDDIVRFFSADMNDRTTLQRLRDSLEEAYNNWVEYQRSEEWDKEAFTWVKDYISENSWDEDEAIQNALTDAGLSEQEKQAAMEAGVIHYTRDTPRTEAYYNWSRATGEANKVLNDLVDEEIQDQGRDYQRARDQWQEDTEYPSENDFLRSEGIRNMTDVESQYDVTWPHWAMESSRSGDVDPKDVADDFGKSIGRPVNFSTSYHGGKRDKVSYVVEPDSSLDSPDDSADGGLEFISPPLPIDEMLSDLKKVKAWADATGCYTNESTGLHINISIDDFHTSNLDYVKLALLLGDEYILDQFGRSANTYTASAMQKVQSNASKFPERTTDVLDSMRSGLSSLASRSIHGTSTNKYTSINTQEGYVEFRSPGGDWLGANFDKIESTLLRMVVALQAACDPTKYRQEYLKKLYQVLDPKGTSDSIAFFSKYVAGEMPAAALKSFIKQMQLQKSLSPGTPRPALPDRQQPVKSKTAAAPGAKYWFRVDLPANGSSIELVATNAEEAIEKAKVEWGLRIASSAFRARPLRKYEETPA